MGENRQEASKYPLLIVFLLSPYFMQAFSDDEDEVDEPLAPLPDEPDVEEDMDQDDRATSIGQGAPASRAVSEPVAPTDAEGTPAPQRHKPHPLSMSLVPGSPSPPANGNGESSENVEITELKPMETTSMDVVSGELSVPDENDVGETILQVPLELEGDSVDIVDLNMAELGPDGAQFEGTGDLSQLQESDSLLGGEALDQSIDPFVEPQ